jgi:hypothetical protein
MQASGIVSSSSNQKIIPNVEDFYSRNLHTSCLDLILRGEYQEALKNIEKGFSKDRNIDPHVVSRVKASLFKQFVEKGAFGQAASLQKSLQGTEFETSSFRTLSEKLRLWAISPLSSFFSGLTKDKVPFFYECLQDRNLKPELMKLLSNRDLGFIGWVCTYAAEGKNDIRPTLELVPLLTFNEARWQIYDAVFKSCKSSDELVQKVFGEGPFKGHAEILGKSKLESSEEYGKLYSLLKLKSYPLKDLIEVVNHMAHHMGKISITIVPGTNDWNKASPSRQFVEDNLEQIFNDFTRDITSLKDIEERAEQIVNFPEIERGMQGADRYKMQDFKASIYRLFIHLGADPKIFMKGFGNGVMPRFLYQCLKIEALKPHLKTWFKSLFGGASYQRQICMSVFKHSPQNEEDKTLCLELASWISNEAENEISL